LTLFSEADVPFESKGPGAIRGLYLFYGCEFASSEQSPGLPPRLTHARNSQPPKRALTYSKNARSRHHDSLDVQNDRNGSRVDGALARTFWRFCSIGRVRLAGGVTVQFFVFVLLSLPGDVLVRGLIK
jgi:hypothetical protein